MGCLPMVVRSLLMALTPSIARGEKGRLGCGLNAGSTIRTNSDGRSVQDDRAGNGSARMACLWSFGQRGGAYQVQVLREHRRDLDPDLAQHPAGEPHALAPPFRHLGRFRVEVGRVHRGERVPAVGVEPGQPHPAGGQVVDRPTVTISKTASEPSCATTPLTQIAGSG